jgi:hypothetical protein
MHDVSEKEKVIRKAARVRIRAVPRLHEQWKKQRKSPGELISVGVGVLVFAAFSFGLPTGLGNAAVEMGGVVWVYILAVALVSLAISMGLGAWLLNELSESSFLAVSSLLPVSDRHIVRDRLWLYAGGVAITLIPTAGFFTAFAWTLTESWTVVGIAAALAVVQASLHGAIGLVLAIWLPRWCNAAIVAALITLGLMGVIGLNWAEQQGLPNPDFILRPLTMVLPTGWNLMCLIQAVAQNSPAGWLFLVPAGLLMIAAILATRHLLAGYRIVEFELLEGATARVTDERGFVQPQFFDTYEFEDDERPLTDLRAEVRSREFLTTNPEEGGMIERMFYEMLSDEERRSVDVLTGGKVLNLTRRVTLVAITLVIVATAGFVADGWFLGWTGLSLIGIAGWLVGITLLRRPEASLLSDRSMLHCGTMSLLPVDWLHFQRVVNLAAILQSLFLLPLSLVISGLGLWALRGHLPFFEAISLSFKPLLVLVAMHQFWMHFLIPLDPAPDRRIGEAKQFFDSMFIVMFGVGAVWIFCVGFSEVWGIVATSLLFGSGWLHQRYYRWLIVRRYTELVAMPPEAEPHARFTR